MKRDDLPPSEEGKKEGPGQGAQMEITSVESDKTIMSRSDGDGKSIVTRACDYRLPIISNGFHGETIDGIPKNSFCVEDLARSALAPGDFPVPPQLGITSEDGIECYKLFYNHEYYKSRHNRTDNKYVGLKGVTPPVVVLGSCHGAPFSASVEGLKKAVLFNLTTGIPTLALDSCWGFGESIDPDSEIKAKELHTDILINLYPGQSHLVLMDGDWATNENVRGALATYRMLLEEQNLKLIFKDLGTDEHGKKRGYDDWFVGRYGIDRTQWPSHDEVIHDLLQLEDIPREELLGTAQSFMLHNIDRFSTEYLDLNDRGAGSLLVKLIGAENLRYLKNRDEWVRWINGRWQNLGDNPMDLVNLASAYYMRRATAFSIQAAKQSDEVKRKQMEALASSYKDFGSKHCSSTVGRQQVLKDLKSRRVLWANTNDFDANIWTLGVANGVVDLRTGELREEEQQDMLLRHCPTRYVENPKGEVTIDGKLYSLPKFLEEVTGLKRDANMVSAPDPESLAYLQKRIGVALVGANPAQSFEIWSGIGANGKSVLKNIIKGALGQTKAGGYAVELKADVVLSNVRGRDAESSTPFLITVDGARIVFCGETKDTQVLDDTLVKRATGDDELSARGNYQEGGNMRVTFTFFLLTNHVPNCTNLDTAMLDRLAITPWDVRWKRPIKVYDDPAEEHLPLGDAWWVDEAKNHPEVTEYILWWLIQGCVKWKTEGIGKAPKKMQTVLASYREDNDRMSDWMSECGWEFDVTAMTPSGEVYRSFKDHMQLRGGHAPIDKVFTKRLIQQYPTLLSSVRPGGKSHIKGIRLKKS